MFSEITMDKLLHRYIFLELVLFSSDSIVSSFIFTGSFGKKSTVDEVTSVITPSVWIESTNYNSAECAISTTQLFNYKLLTEYKVRTLIVSFFPYITSIPGLITNPLTIHVAISIKPYTTSELHMLLLGVTDLLVVIVRLSIHFLYEFKFQLTNFWCKTLYFTLNSSYVLSNWILVSWTVERFIAVMFPIKVYKLYTLTHAKTTIALFLVMSCAVASPHITEMYSVPVGDSIYCQPTQYYYETYAMFENSVYMYLPIFIITMCNISIIFKTRQATKRRCANTSDLKILSKRVREQNQMTTVLIVVASSFFFLHITQVLAKVWQAVYSDHSEIYQYSFKECIIFLLFTNLGYQITDFQNSINFFLYCAFGTKVRQILYKLYCSSRRVNMETGDAITTISTSYKNDLFK